MTADPYAAATLVQLRRTAAVVLRARGTLDLTVDDLWGAGWLGYQSAAARGVSHRGCMERAEGAMRDELRVIAGHAKRADTSTQVDGAALHALTKTYRHPKDRVQLSHDEALAVVCTEEHSAARGFRPRMRGARNRPGFAGLPRHVRRAIGRLPAKQQAALRMRVMRDVPVADVASLMGASANAVHLSRHRALASLHARYGVVS